MNPNGHHATMRAIRLAPLLLATVVAGCANSGGLHTNGTAIDAATLHSERSFAKIKTTQAAWPASDWWTRLGDAQLCPGSAALAAINAELA